MGIYSCVQTLKIILGSWFDNMLVFFIILQCNTSLFAEEELNERKREALNQ